MIGALSLVVVLNVLIGMVDAVGWFSTENQTDWLESVEVAATLYEPTVLFAMNVGAVAKPLPSVTTSALGLSPSKVPVAPEGPEVAAKVTVTPTTGALKLSRICTSRAGATAWATSARVV
ncbi:MAG TPA: hypothetical protein VF441_06195, partial [Acidimicrobiia bacterium]